MYQSLRVSADGSATSDRCLLEAIKLGWLTRAKLLLIYAVDKLSFAMNGDYGVVGSVHVLGLLQEAGGEILNKAKSVLLASGLEVDTERSDSSGGRSCDPVLAHVGTSGADLVGFGTRGQGGGRSVLMGSDAENVVGVSTLPLLLLHADPAAASLDA